MTMLYPHDHTAEESAIHPDPIPGLLEEDEDENWGAGEPGVDYEDNEAL